MKSKVDKEPEYKECYIAFIDILGFKDLVCNRLGCKEIKDIFEFIDKTQLENAVIFSDDDKNIPLDKVKKYIMSDSIILYIEKSIKNSLKAIMMQAQFLQVILIKKRYPIIVSGAITCGKIYRNKSYIFGPGIVDAYNLQDEKPHYPRIIVDSKLLEPYLNYADLSDRDKNGSLWFKDKRDYKNENCDDCIYVINYLWRIEFDTIQKPIKDIISSLDKKNEAGVIDKYNYIINYYKPTDY